MTKPQTATTPSTAELNASNRLALSILQHRTFCPDCAPHADQAALALQGATITDLTNLNGEMTT